MSSTTRDTIAAQVVAQLQDKIPGVRGFGGAPRHNFMQFEIDEWVTKYGGGRERPVGHIELEWDPNRVHCRSLTHNGYHRISYVGRNVHGASSMRGKRNQRDLVALLVSLCLEHIRPATRE